jgi:hypothetical protein
MLCSNCKLPLPSGQLPQSCPRCFTVNRPEKPKPSKPKLARKPARKAKPIPASEPAIEINDDEPESE